jgi:large subunit ribosomal protein L21
MVKPGDRFTIPLLDAEPGTEITLDDVLVFKGEGDVQIGRPKVEGARVTAKVVGHTHNPKIMVYKFIKRENYRRKRGHKQPMTEIEITQVGMA